MPISLGFATGHTVLECNTVVMYLLLFFWIICAIVVPSLSTGYNKLHLTHLFASSFFISNALEHICLKESMHIHLSNQSI